MKAKNPAHKKLSIMMFLYYASLGFVTPMLSVYLMGTNYLGFSGHEAGLITAMEALAVVVSPLIGAFITDRLIPAEVLMGILQMAAGVLLIFFPFFESFPIVLTIFIFYELLYIPGSALTNTIAFHHSPDGGKNFGGIRKWGTIGWIVAGWVVAAVSMMVKNYDYRPFFIVGGVLAICLGLFSIVFLRERKKDSETEAEIRSLQPELKEKVSPWRKVFPVEAFKCIFQKEVLFIFFISVLIKLVDKYYYFGCSPFLSSQGVGEKWIPAIMSLGQISEVILLSFLGTLIDRWGYKKILMVGILAEVARFSFLGFSNSLPITLLAFPFHGISYACFSGTAYIFINQGTDRKSRAGVQHIYALVTGVVGSFFGSTIPGAVVAKSTAATGSVNYLLFWMIPGVMALLAAILVLFLRSSKKGEN